MDRKGIFKKFIVLVAVVYSAASFSYVAPLAPEPPPRKVTSTHFYVIAQSNGCFLNMTVTIWSDGSVDSEKVTICPRG